MNESEIKTILPNPDIETLPEYPEKLILGENMEQVLALLQAWNGNARKLVRCDDLGGICTSPMYGQFRKNTLISQLTVQNTWTNVSGIPSDCMAVTIASPSGPTQVRVYTVSGGSYYTLLCPSNRQIDIPHRVGALTVNTFPAATGAATTIGIMCWQPRKIEDKYK